MCVRQATFDQTTPNKLIPKAVLQGYRLTQPKHTHAISELPQDAPRTTPAGLHPVQAPLTDCNIS